MLGHLLRGRDKSRLVGKHLVDKLRNRGGASWVDDNLVAVAETPSELLSEEVPKLLVQGAFDVTENGCAACVPGQAPRDFVGDQVNDL